MGPPLDGTGLTLSGLRPYSLECVVGLFEPPRGCDLNQDILTIVDTFIPFSPPVGPKFRFAGALQPLV